MAAYNPCNFDLSQFMNDLFQQPDLANQLQFLGSHLQVINLYAAGLELELTRVNAIAIATQAQAQAQPGTLGVNLKESRSICRSRQLQWRDQPL
jgi:hypothetical protein